jgi:hypothetical protein
MSELHDHIIDSEGDGRLTGTTSATTVRQIVRSLAGRDVVLHFHGGLVNRHKGTRIAERLLPEYERADHYPVFFLYEAGALQTVFNNLDEIGDNSGFSKLIEAIVQESVIGRLAHELWVLLVGQDHRLAPPADTEARQGPDSRWELSAVAQTAQAGDQTLTLRPELVEGTEAEVGLWLDQHEQAFAAEIAADHGYLARIGTLLAPVVLSRYPGLDLHVPGDALTAPGWETTRRPLMSSDVLDDLLGTSPQAAVLGLRDLESLGFKLGRHAYQAGRRVVKRKRAGHDHGTYATFVEELCREFYLEAIAQGIWGSIKNDTAETFVETEGEERAGEVFLKELARQYCEGRGPHSVSLVGHSTGAIFINNLLAAVRRSGTAGDHAGGSPFPLNFRFRNVVFLAPACTVEGFASTLQDCADLIDRFRMFAMSDSFESKDALVPLIYTRSMLYFVSGVAEAGSGDVPILGMDRYHGSIPGTFDNEPGVREVRAFFQIGNDRAVWSVTGAGAPVGMQSDAVEHGGFDDTDDDKRHGTMKSVVAMLSAP